MAVAGEDRLLSDCRSGWLAVESDFSSSLTKPEQLKYALQCMGRNPSEKTIKHYWAQCGGSMSFDQFSTAMRRERKATKEDLLQAFRKIDTNGDGYISAEELTRMLTKRGEKMSHDEVQAIIDEADQNQDGKLDYAEFCHLLQNTVEECIRASQLRASRLLEETERKSVTSLTSQTSLTQRHRSGRPQRRGTFERRERRREEIRLQLYSSEDQLRKESSLLARRYPKVPEGGENLEPQDEATLFQQQDVLKPSIPVPEVERVQSTTSVEKTGTQTREVTECKQNIQEKLVNSERKTHSTAEFNSVHKEDSKPKLETAHTRKSKQTSLRKELSDPFDISAASNLPPLKTSLPPLLPSITSQTTTDHRTPEEKGLESTNVEQEAAQNEKKSGRQEGSSDELLSKLEPNGIPVQEAGEEEEVTLTGSDTTAAETERKAGVEGRTSMGNMAAEADSKVSDSQQAANEGGETKCPTEKERKPVSESKPLAQTSPSCSRKEQTPLQDGGEGRQTDHLPSQNPPGVQSHDQRKAASSSSSSVVAPPPKKPKSLELWNSISGKGCIYLDMEEGQEEAITTCHQYRLNLPSPTHIWIEVGVENPGCLATDVLLFVFHTDEAEEPTTLITYTQHKINKRWACKLDLEAGSYALIPFTSGCHLKPREDEERGEAVSLVREEERKTVLTDACREALTEVFHRMDLDGNNVISRTEFDFFQERTSGEVCDDDTWKVIQENFEMTSDDELTLQGFLDLHVMTVRDEEGGEAEVWEVLSSLGYNKQLQLDQACPFELEVFTEDCEGEIEIVDLLPFSPIVDPALCQLVMERGVCEELRDGRGELYTHTLSTPHMTTIAVENKGSKKVSVQLDCSRSTNAVASRESSVHVLEVLPNSIIIGFHLVPENVSEPHKIHCIASRILC